MASTAHSAESLLLELGSNSLQLHTMADEGRDLLTQRAMEYLHSHEDEIEGALRAAVGDLVSQRPADPLEHLIKVLRTRRTPQRSSVDPDASGEEVRRLRTEVQFHKDDAAAARAELGGVRQQLDQFCAFAEERLTSAERRAAAAEARAAAR